MTDNGTVIAYHFVGEALRDGSAVPADGEWLEHGGVCTICASGLHASRTPAHALPYAPGNIVCKVECAGIEDEHADKFVCRRRRITARIDITGVLREYARWCALQVIDLWDAPTVVRKYLETGDDSLRAASEAASEAAWAAKKAARAAKMAAKMAASEAASEAAWAAAAWAAKMAASEAASEAAWAAWAAKKAAKMAARTTAASAEKRQQAKFNQLVEAAFSSDNKKESKKP